MTAAAQAGTGAGHNLAGVGMNVNLAPVLDVFDKSGNFIDEYQRSYSNNATVTSCEQAFISAQRKTGVAARLLLVISAVLYGSLVMTPGYAWM